MKTNKWAIRGLVAAGSLLAMGAASASVVAWTDWTSIGGSGASGTMGGVGVNITATGGTMNGVSQTQCGVNYWGQPNLSDPAYTGGTVLNAPTACEQVGLNSPVTVTVTFSSAVDTLYMALLSIGQTGRQVTYDFDRSFAVDSDGIGHWSNNTPGTYTLGAGDTISMREFHGVLRFSAPVTSMTFSTNPDEYWHAFTFGMAVPEPGSLALVGVALLGAGALTRRRKAA